jgi:predicted dehydrogenase
MTRRKLFQATTAAALSYSRILGANDRVRTGLVGFSDRAHDALIPAFFANAKQQNFEMGAVADIWKLRRDEAATWISKLATSQVEALRNEEELFARKDIDAVIIATADFQHAPHATAAVRAGKDVYVEKPLANQISDARALLKAVTSTSRVVQIGTQRRSAKNTIAARNFIQSGEFGAINEVRLTSHFNQPARWLRRELIAKLRAEDTDWNRWRLQRSKESFNARHYFEFRLFWPYSTGMFDQWMVHQIDALHMITGLKYPRTAVASGGTYTYRDGRTSPDTAIALFEYGDAPNTFLVEFSGRMANAAGGTEDTYYSHKGTLQTGAGKVSGDGGLIERYAKLAGQSADTLPDKQLFAGPAKKPGRQSSGEDELRADATTSAHMKNWMECVRSRKAPVADIHAGYGHSIALCMAITAFHKGKKVSFDERTQDIVTV